MAGLTLDRVTHGDGAGGASGVDDGDASTCSFPSGAPTHASGWPGDLVDGDVKEPFILPPPWTYQIQCAEGSWGIDETRGGGETSSGGEAEARQVKESGHVGNLGGFHCQLGWPLDGAKITAAYAA